MFACYHDENKELTDFKDIWGFGFIMADISGKCNIELIWI